MNFIRFAVALFLLILIILTVMWWDEMNVFWSHPIVSGGLMVVVASIVIPRRIEIERQKVLENGFYSDLSFILNRYKKIMEGVINCASMRRHSRVHGVGEVVVGNECIRDARLNINLALSSSQKEALIIVENAIDITNRNLQENIKGLNAAMERKVAGVHSDLNMKAAAKAICHIIYLLSKCLEQKGRYNHVNTENAEVYTAALYVLFEKDRAKSELIKKWLLSDDTLPVLEIESRGLDKT
ncbi:hypothetical protein J2Y65_000103 [Aeromonas salmonicida]|uniref:hypothetical protein n=1 Tax=Aeromonas salmonicida TaxID=645 RepID=UPI00285EB9BD|nr:hypothetical protein [Aeromonas salmonicida]MDR6993479.1 hypothetical protein [Aeromonas salmonicida]